MGDKIVKQMVVEERIWDNEDRYTVIPHIQTNWAKGTRVRVTLEKID
jgi:hypothetical protein